MKKTLLILSAFIFTGCIKEMDQIVKSPVLDTYLGSKGVSSEQRNSLIKLSTNFVKSMEDITPEQEYYIGRTVSANLFSRYKPYNNLKAQSYINQIGYQLSYASELPNTYGGYHFQILDSDEINAFAAPGGFIFMTRGILRCAHSEDAVAAIIAHEIAHITNRHGLRSIKSSRWSEMGSLLAIEATKHYTNENVATLVKTFEGSITDIMNTMVVNGYSRDYELEADQTAVKILEKSGYDSSAITKMLNEMETKIKPGERDFASTHPSPSDRVEALNQSTLPSEVIPVVRQKRFSANLAKI